MEDPIEIIHPGAHAQEAPLRKLLQAQRRYAEAETGLDRAREARDAAIREATDAGLTRRALARATGLTAGRIQQIIDAGREGGGR
jgi:hypothetical protein